MASSSIALETRRTLAPTSGTRGVAARRAGSRWTRGLRTITGLGEDALLLLFAGLLLPVAIFAVGIPIALFIRLLLEIAERL